MDAELFRVSNRKARSFLACQKQYWYRYLSGLEAPPEEEGPQLIVGKAVHRAMKALCDTDDPGIARQMMDAYLRMPKHAIAAPGTEWYAQAEALFGRGVEAHRSIESEERWAELDTWAPWPSAGITLTARIDRVDRLSADHYQIVDWKTGAMEVEEETDAQLDIGHVAARVSLHMPRDARVTAIGWNLRSGERRVRELVREDAEATMAYMGAMARRMRATTGFVATPGGTCRLCEWAGVCEEAKLAWE